MIRLKEKADPEPVDALTVAEELARAGELEEAGGTAYVHSLPNLVPSAGNVRHYGRIVKNHALMRRLLDTTRRIQDDVFTFQGPPKELLEQAESELFKIAHDDRTGELRPIEDVLHDELDKLELISREGHRDDRHAHRLHRPRRADGRPPAGQPDRLGRKPLYGKKRVSNQHR